MQIIKNGWVKFLLGIALVSGLLFSIFSILPGYIATYGATEKEIADTYPGDEILTKPVIMWTHGATISAPPEKVWPWIAQIGQSRGGFYSYTFIENMIAHTKTRRKFSPNIKTQNRVITSSRICFR
jgi:hypothetical protein